MFPLISFSVPEANPKYYIAFNVCVYTSPYLTISQTWKIFIQTWNIHNIILNIFYKLEIFIILKIVHINIFIDLNFLIKNVIYNTHLYVIYNI